MSALFHLYLCGRNAAEWLIGMKISCLQMNMKLGLPEENFAHAEQLIIDAMKEKTDVLVLPETWNTGFFRKKSLPSYPAKTEMR